MRYQGGKARLATRIATILNTERKQLGIDSYIEPFVGSAVVLAQIDAPIRIASDLNSDMIALFQALQTGWLPPSTITAEQYSAYRQQKDNIDPALRAFVSIGCSFGGKRWGGFAREGARNPTRDLANESYRSLVKQAPQLAGAVFLHRDYRTIDPGVSQVYCDPPYADTLGYNGTAFDSDEFWEIMRRWASTSVVYVSEYTAPADIEIIAEWEHNVSLKRAERGGIRKRTTERLYRLGKSNKD